MKNVPLKLTWEVWESEEGPFVAVCDDLNATMEGDTLDELGENIRDATDLIMSACLEDFVGKQPAQPKVRKRRVSPGCTERGRPLGTRTFTLVEATA